MPGLPRPFVRLLAVVATIGGFVIVANVLTLASGPALVAISAVLIAVWVVWVLAVGALVYAMARAIGKIRRSN